MKAKQRHILIKKKRIPKIQYLESSEIFGNLEDEHNCIYCNELFTFSTAGEV